MGYAVRNSHYRYIEWRDYENGEVVSRELYDSDNMENENLIDSVQYSDIVSDLSSALKSGAFKFRR